MNTEKKPRRRKSTRLSQDQRVSDILAAANDLIDTKGYENVTMVEIAERSHIVEGTVYRYFKNKDELMLRVAEDWLRLKLADLLDVSALNGTYNKLRYLIWHSLKVIVSKPAVTRYIMLEVRPRESYKTTELFSINRAYTNQLRKLFADAISSGEMKRGVPERLLRDMVFGTIEHSTWRYLRGEGDLDVDELADEIAMVVFHGMSDRQPVTNPLEASLARIEAVAERLEKAVPAG
ncbi:TetR/AcrR family transcriptional regulator [Novosphingobium colocasiae]|nr:TetR/AcrR family transcriptional regulator [Novosphingobium colocasiae]